MPHSMEQKSRYKEFYALDPFCFLLRDFRCTSCLYQGMRGGNCSQLLTCMESLDWSSTLNSLGSEQIFPLWGEWVE